VPLDRLLRYDFLAVVTPPFVGEPREQVRSAMPKIRLEELASWVNAFREAETQTTDPRTVDLSWDQDTVDTALVVASLHASGTSVYLQREIGGSPEWWATFEPREDPARLTAADIVTLTHEVAAVGRLCEFLSERTAEHLRTTAQ
jgi:hypothetical protein